MSNEILYEDEYYKVTLLELTDKQDINPTELGIAVHFSKQLQASQQRVVRLEKIIERKQRSVNHYAMEVVNLQTALQEKEAELKALNDARDEMCNAGQEDIIGIIRDKNAEIKCKDEALEEIKNIANKAQNYDVTECPDGYVDNLDLSLGIIESIAKQALQGGGDE